MLLIPSSLRAGMSFIDDLKDNGMGTNRKLQPTASMFDPACVETKVMMVQYLGTVGHASHFLLKHLNKVTCNSAFMIADEIYGGTQKPNSIW